MARAAALISSLEAQSPTRLMRAMGAGDQRGGGRDEGC